VTVASDADSALDIIQRDGSFDLLFTDIVMPGKLNGLALARELRGLSITTPILFTSGFSSPATLSLEIDSFGAQLIPKPYRKAELAAAVSAMLNPITVD
jgi:DNA-binding response OmpR family regulator